MAMCREKTGNETAWNAESVGEGGWVREAILESVIA